MECQPVGSQSRPRRAASGRALTVSRPASGSKWGCPAPWAVRPTSHRFGGFLPCFTLLLFVLARAAPVLRSSGFAVALMSWSAFICPAVVVGGRCSVRQSRRLVPVVPLWLALPRPSAPSPGSPWFASARPARPPDLALHPVMPSLPRAKKKSRASGSTLS